MECPTSNHILIVEDDPAMQALMATQLRSCGFCTTTASDGNTALKETLEHPPTLVLLDWMLPGSPGIEVLKTLRSNEATHDIPVIMVTGRMDESDVLAGFEAGADDYLTKPFAPSVLLARVRAVLRRTAPELTDEVVRLGPVELSPARQRVFAHGREVGLGLREFRLLHVLMSRADHVYSRAQLLDHVWGHDVYVGERTVDVHVLNLRRALEPVGVDSRVQTVRGRGYRYATA